MQIIIKSGLSSHSAILPGAKFGSPYGEKLRLWLTHDGIMHGVGAEILKSRFGNFIYNQYGENKNQSHGYSGEAATDAVQNFLT